MGVVPGRAHRHLVDERPGMGRHAVRRRPDRRRACQCQPGLSAPGTQGRAGDGRRGDARRRLAVQGLEFRLDGRDPLPRRWPAAGPRLVRREVPASAAADRRWVTRPGPGWWTWSELEARRERPGPSRSRTAWSARAARHLQHPVHLGDDRPAQGRDAHAPECAR